jgi:hypothetical protein
VVVIGLVTLILSELHRLLGVICRLFEQVGKYMRFILMWADEDSKKVVNVYLFIIYARS